MNNPISQAEGARLLKLATNASIAVALLLIAAKGMAYWQTSSMSILASLVDSLMDSGASLFNLIAVRYALVPADRQHRFGHGKAESIAALAQSTLIIGSGLYLVVEAGRRLMNPEPLTAFGMGVAVMVFTVVVTIGLVALQSYVIRRTGSAAIRADSLHYRTDVLTNSGVIVALILAQFGWPGMDPLFAIATAIYILYSARAIMRDAFNELLDRELPEEQRALIQKIAEDHPDVKGVHDLRTRSSGRVEFIELHLELDGNMSLLRSHSISDEVEDAIIKKIPAADVVIHQDPAGIDEVQQDEQLE
ncbi:divalent metal cation transporter FieF [Kineobactrum sediminis]|uniref:Cation-efflux pump FieF n=1 Tax=Kineobactrum sediminis TaxID=1905677 RepID=A0A2N5Y6K1_9GAMM|nr:cation diffusion facilitator family transporter [Kineobactrum sediminis]PLW84001.1 divalent metal cation transporter FieF [Kineobactrum sediminis]